MNRDSDITKEILLELLFEAVSTGNSPSGATPPQANSATPAHPGSGDSPPPSPHASGSDPLVWADARPVDDFAHLNPIFDPGDLPAVQTHFEALLKRRLRQEIAHRPPVFPWEKGGLHDYPETLNHESGTASIWLDHLKNLDVPADLPDAILTNLLIQCQHIAQQTLQAGRRLVSAVEVLFPDQPQTLELIAGMVSRPAYRSAPQTLERADYATASAQQQIALSMLTAQKIFEALTITVSAAQPTQRQDWLTPCGPLTVAATYAPGDRPQLDITVELPAAGNVVLAPTTEAIRAERATPGPLVVRLMVPQPATPYALDVTLTDYQSAPLSFQIIVEANGTQA